MVSMKVITVIILFLKTANCVFIHPVHDEFLLKICKNDFAVPVAKRTNVEKAAVVKFWRSKGTENTDNALYYDGRKAKEIYLINL